MIKINFNEYENMVARLNINKNKLVLIVGAVIVFVAAFFIYYRTFDLITCFVLSIIFSVLTYWLTKYLILKKAKRINLINKIIEVQQIITDEWIEEKVVKEDNNFNEVKFKYEDIIKVREDNKYMFLYIQKNAALIIDKTKLEDEKQFKENLKSKVKCFK